MRRFSRRKIKITKAGYSFMLMTLGIGIAALNTGNNLLYLLFGMLLSFIIISGILSDTSMRKLAVSREVPAEITANAVFPVKLSVLNRKKYIPSYALSIADVGDQRGEGLRFIIKVSAGEKRDIFYFSKFLERGIRKYAGFNILTKYPFGLIQKTDFVPKEEEVLVYPEIFDLEGVLAGNRLFHGEYLSGEKGVGVNPWGLRSYQYGDDARLIHWKSTAKKGEWMIKEFESEKKLRVVLDLILVSPEGLNHKGYIKKSEERLIEKQISLCASLIMYLVRSNYEVLLTVNDRIISSTGRGYIANYLKALALLNASKFPAHIDSLNSPLDGESMHVVITNLSSRFVSNKIDNVAITMDRDSGDLFCLKEYKERELT